MTWKDTGFPNCLLYLGNEIEKLRYSNRTVKYLNRAVSKPGYKNEYSNHTYSNYTTY